MQTIQYNNANVAFSNTALEEASKTPPPQASVSAPQNKQKPQTDIITPPSLCDRYCFEKIIGQGTQGTVYQAKRLKDGNDVAIKQLNVHSVKNWKDYELFHREASVLESLDVPGIARFYEAIDCLEDEPPCSYIVQEWIKGKSIQQMLNEGHRFTMAEVYDILIQSLKILEELHHHEPPIIHRDIKPSNLMLTPSKVNSSYQVTIIDFGAVANPQVQGGGSTMAGTYGYMPPEQLMGAPTPASDIYALAAVGVQLFTGIAPGNLPTKDFTLIFEPEMQNKPHELVSLLRQMLNPKAEDRLTDIQTIRERLEQFKLGNYLIATKRGHALNAEYEDKLHELVSIFDPGAMELWKDLSDTAPRDVPLTYRNALSNIKGQVPFSIRLQSFKLSVKQKWSQLFYNYIKPALIATIIFACFYLINRFWDWVKGTDKVSFNIILSVIVTIVYLYIFYTNKISNNDNNRDIPKPTKLQMNKSNDSECTVKMIKLMEEGRKTIATIVDIQYVPIPDAWVVAHSKPKEIPLESFQPHPQFIIRYRFNPPDDLREEDIIHEYTTHELPNENPGDLLPILYMIESLGGQDAVYSIPYPIPLHDLVEPSLVVDHSKSAFIHPQIDIDVWLSAEAQSTIDKLNRAQSLEELNQIIKRLDFKQTSSVEEFTQFFIGSDYTERESSNHANRYHLDDIYAYIHTFKSYLQIKSTSFISIHYNCIKQFDSLIRFIVNSGIKYIVKSDESEPLIETIADILAQYLTETPANQLNDMPQMLSQFIRIEHYLNSNYEISASNKLRDAFLNIYRSGEMTWESKELLEEYRDQRLQ